MSRAPHIIPGTAAQAKPLTVVSMIDGVTANEKPMGPAQLDTIEALDAAGWAGMTMAEMATACGRRLENQEVVVHLLHKRGYVVYRVELSDRLRKSRRWWLAKFAPRPDAYQITDPSMVARHRTGTLADPWRVTAAGRVVDSSQCRPWAMAAAAQIGREAIG